MNAFEVLDKWIHTLGLQTPVDCRSSTRDKDSVNEESSGEELSDGLNQELTSSTLSKPAASEFPDRLLLTVARQAMACEFEVLLKQHQ